MVHISSVIPWRMAGWKRSEYFSKWAICCCCWCLSMHCLNQELVYIHTHTYISKYAPVANQNHAHEDVRHTLEVGLAYLLRDTEQIEHVTVTFPLCWHRMTRHMMAQLKRTAFVDPQYTCSWPCNVNVWITHLVHTYRGQTPHTTFASKVL